MTPTTSSALFLDLAMPISQTRSMDQDLASQHPELDYDIPYRGTANGIDIVLLFDDRTDDNGVLLRWGLPRVKWVFNVSYKCVLPQVTTSDAMLTKTSSRLLRREQFVEVMPHLEALQWIKEATGLSQERIGRLIGVTRQTLNNWEKGVPIADVNRRRLFAVRDVLKRAAGQYPTPALLVVWLDTPRGADGHTPAELLEMDEINKARYHAVSSPSPGLVPPPAWVNRPVPEAFRKGAERRQEALPPYRDDEMSDAEAAEYEINEDVEDLPLDE